MEWIYKSEFGITIENGPRFTAFATTEERLHWHLDGEHRPMYAFCDNEKIVGYYSLLLQDNNECELNNLCVIPAYRHKGIGEELLKNDLKEQTIETLRKRFFYDRCTGAFQKSDWQDIGA